MSDAQQEHVFVIEHLAPRLAALRIELCPCHMSGNYFWKVYFVLLHSRLNKQDAETLSTTQVKDLSSLAEANISFLHSCFVLSIIFYHELSINNHSINQLTNFNNISY